MTKEDYDFIIEASKMRKIELSVLKPEENYLKKNWNFVTEVQKDTTN